MIASTTFAQNQPFGLDPRYIRMISEIVYSYPSVTRAVIFGSRAMGNYQKGSDIDIALYGSLDHKKLPNGADPQSKNRK